MNVFDFAASPMSVCDMMTWDAAKSTVPGVAAERYPWGLSGVRMATCSATSILWMWGLFCSISTNNCSGWPSHVSPIPCPLSVVKSCSAPTKIITIMRCLDLWFLSPLGRNNSGFKFASVFRRCGMWCWTVGYQAERAWIWSPDFERIRSNHGNLQSWSTFETPTPRLVEFGQIYIL